MCSNDRKLTRNKIRKNNIEGNSYEIGSELDYALFVEVGTSKIAPRPFLRRAVNNKDNYR